MKLCKDCGELKSLSEFSKHPTNKDRHQQKCKKCCAVYQKNWLVTNRESNLIKQKAWYAANRDKQKVHSAAWQKANPEKFKQYMRKVKLKQRYGLSVEQFDEMVQQQRGQCVICGTSEPGNRFNKPGRWYVDHCHATGKVRGLLCAKCNAGLGFFGDDPVRLLKAAEYIRRSHNASVDHSG